MGRWVGVYQWVRLHILRHDDVADIDDQTTAVPRHRNAHCPPHGSPLCQHPLPCIWVCRHRPPPPTTTTMTMKKKRRTRRHGAQTSSATQSTMNRQMVWLERCWIRRNRPEDRQTVGLDRPSSHRWMPRRENPPETWIESWTVPQTMTPTLWWPCGGDIALPSTLPRQRALAAIHGAVTMSMPQPNWLRELGCRVSPRETRRAQGEPLVQIHT